MFVFFLLPSKPVVVQALERTLRRLFASWEHGLKARLYSDMHRGCSCGFSAGERKSKGGAIYSNSAETFKWPKNREDNSDLDENLTESIAATQTSI